MQIRDAVKGLHNCWEFSQPPECLDESMKTGKKVSNCFNKILFSNKMTNEGKFFSFTWLIEISSIHTLGASHDTHLPAHKPIKIHVIKIEVVEICGKR